MSNKNFKIRCIERFYIFNLKMFDIHLEKKIYNYYNYRNIEHSGNQNRAGKRIWKIVERKILITT